MKKNTKGGASERSRPIGSEPGLEEFLKDASLSGDATAKEIEFFKSLKFKARRPAPLYYYRELQNLRDPLHLRTSGPTRRSWLSLGLHFRGRNP